MCKNNTGYISHAFGAQITLIPPNSAVTADIRSRHCIAAVSTSVAHCCAFGPCGPGLPLRQSEHLAGLRVGPHPCGGCRGIDLVHTGVRREAHAVAYPHREREISSRKQHTADIHAIHTNYHTSNHTITNRLRTILIVHGLGTYLSQVSYSSSSSHVTTRR